MAKDCADLLETEMSTVIADTGYYNGTEIKKCIDDGMNVFIKKQKQTIVQKITNSEKRSFLMIKIMMCISVLLVISFLFSKTRPRTELNTEDINAQTVILVGTKMHVLPLQVVVLYNAGSTRMF